MLGLQTILPLLLTAAMTNAAPNTTENTAVSPLIASSVKLRVDADQSHSWGTGTIVDTRQGEALILTCGHIFRDSKGAGNVEVHLFGEHSTVKVLGKCLFYDLEIDLGLVAVRPPCPVQALPIMPANGGLGAAVNQQVYSVGCDHGGNPTLKTHQVLSIDRIGTPKENKLPFHYIQVAGAPVSGRSGGGLFSAEGHLIGVCNTADPVANDGHFVPASVIRYVLDQKNLSEVHKTPSLVSTTPPPTMSLPKVAPLEQRPEGLTALATLPPLPNAPKPAMAEPLPKYADVPAPTGMNSKERATLEEIKRRKQDGDEVILIVRSRRNPEVPSDVIVLNGTSEQFLDALVRNPPPSRPDGYNPVIFSSHESSPHETENLAKRTAVPPPVPAGSQPVSFPVQH